MEIPDELSNGDNDQFVTCEEDDVDNVFKSSPIDDHNEFNLPVYNNGNNNSIGVSGEHGDDEDDITLPPVNMMMDVLEHMLTEVSAVPTNSSSSSSISEPAPEQLDIVPESPKSITSTTFTMDKSEEKSEDSCADFNNQFNDDKQTNIETPKFEESIEKKKANKLTLVCDRISKNIDPGSDLSTPSPIEEISKLQLQIAQQEKRASDSINTTTSTTTTPTSLSTMSLLSSVMSIHANKALTEKESTDEIPVTSSTSTGETKSSLKASMAAASTVNACADFFNALLKSDKTLTSVSNQGN